MRVYVSGSSREIARCDAAIDLLLAHGIESHDWPSDFEDPPHDRAGLLRALRGDLAAIRRCDVLLFLEPAEPSVGAWVELGYAAGLGTCAIIAAGPSAPSEWPHACGVERAFALDLAACEYVIAMAQARESKR